MAPPGRPNMTSTPSISRLLMRACAPVSFIAVFSGLRTVAGNETTSRLGGRGRTRRGQRALGQDYDEEEGGAGHRSGLSHAACPGSTRVNSSGTYLVNFCTSTAGWVTAR